MFIQDDLTFVAPPSSAVPLNALTVKEYLPEHGKLSIFSETGAQPHVVEGRNFRLQVGRKLGGRHTIAVLAAAETVVVRYGKKDELTLDGGVYYVQLTGNGAGIPVVA